MNNVSLPLSAIAALVAGASRLAVAQDAAPSPEVLKTHPEAQQSASAAELVQSAADAPRDGKGRRLAPRDTFYLLSYVAATTDKGVEGFPPGQEVRLVEVHRETQTLVVTNGRVQVEVAPSQLTNDMEIAALVSRNDQASQAKITEYVQAEQAAYNKAQREVAEGAARNIERHDRELADNARKAALTKLEQPAATTNASIAGNGYYGNGGYGYGSPYSYFSGGAVTVPAQPPAAAAPAPAAAPVSIPNKVAVPPGGGAGGARPR